MPMPSPQHDDHIWLTAGGEAWAIYHIRLPLLYLWRGYYPNIEYSILDISQVDWESYTQKAVKQLQGA
jgi:hypothetical protein